MRIGRTIPPAAAPIGVSDIISGLKGLAFGEMENCRFGAELKAYFGVKHCFLVSSGKTALAVILQALRQVCPERHGVLIPAFTCYSVPSAIARAGLQVCLCDIDPDTLDFNYDQLGRALEAHPAQPQPAGPLPETDPTEALVNSRKDTPFAPGGSSIPGDRVHKQKGSIRDFRDIGQVSSLNPRRSSRLLAVIPTHLFGLPSDIARLRELIDDPEIAVIEDAAQTMGGEWNGRQLGTLGDVSFFSLGRGKVMSTVEGGIILTSRDDIAERIKRVVDALPVYGWFSLLILLAKAMALGLFLNPSLFWIPRSLPFLGLGSTIYDPDFPMKKMSPFQAGMARSWRTKINEFKKRRADNTARWAAYLGCRFSLVFLGNGGRLPDLIRFPIYVPDREFRTSILKASEEVGLGIMHTYPDSIDKIPALYPHFLGRAFPEAKRIAAGLITLPVHPFLNSKDMLRIEGLLGCLVNGDGNPANREPAAFRPVSMRPSKRAAAT